MILNGGVLGDVTHYYWKKEYQARGAPHNHVLLWIDGAPVIDHDDPEDVLSWLVCCQVILRRSNIPRTSGSRLVRTRVSTQHCGRLVSALCVAWSAGCTKLVTYCLAIT